MPWFAIGLGCAALVVGAVVLVSLPPAPQPLVRSTPEAVGLRKLDAGADDEALREEIALQDPTPLFLPTEWNTSRATIPGDIQREPGVALQRFPPQLSFRDGNPGIAFPLPVELPASPVAALRAMPAQEAVQSVGRRDGAGAVSLSPRFGAVEVVQASDGRVVLTDDLPAVAGAPVGDWMPVELLAAVGPGGLIGTPVLTASSGSEEMDLWLPHHLAKAYRLGERLRPGFYRIAVGP